MIPFQKFCRGITAGEPMIWPYIKVSFSLSVKFLSHSKLSVIVTSIARILCLLTRNKSHWTWWVSEMWLNLHRIVLQTSCWTLDGRITTLLFLLSTVIASTLINTLLRLVDNGFFLDIGLTERQKCVHFGNWWVVSIIYSLATKASKSACVSKKD